MSDESGIVPLRPRSDTEPQAADWLAKLDRGDLTAEERAAFGRWLREGPANRDAIQDLAAFWYLLNPAPMQARAGSPRIRQAPAWLTGAVAATFAMFAIVLTVVALHEAFRPAEETAYFATEVGETQTVTLSDGSQIILNTGSIVEQEFAEEKRVVRLVTGEAIFDVAHDEERPFEVHAGDGTIRALGTRFSVRMEPEKVSVTVTEGRILLQQRRREPGGHAGIVRPVGKTLSGSIDPVVVGRGEAGEIGRATGASKQIVSERDVAERLSWTQGRLVFYDRELQSVIDEITRYMDIEIEIENETLKRKKITGILEIGDVEVMLDGIEGSLGVTVDRLSPNLVHLTSG